MFEIFYDTPVVLTWYDLNNQKY